MPRFAVCLLVFVGATTPVLSQTKTYIDAQCSYTAPGVEWEWYDPKLAQGEEARTLAIVKNPSGLTFTLRYRPQDQRPDVNSFSHIEENLLASGRLKKLNTRRITFKGASCYEIDVQSVRGDEWARIRVLFANEKVYQLAVTYAPGPLGPTEETDHIFKGFEFRSPEEIKRDREQKSKNLRTTPLFVWLGVLAAMASLVWWFVRLRKAAVG